MVKASAQIRNTTFIDGDIRHHDGIIANVALCELDLNVHDQILKYLIFLKWLELALKCLYTTDIEVDIPHRMS